MSRSRKLLEEVNCSDDKRNDEDSFCSDNSSEEDYIEKDVPFPDFGNCMSDSENSKKVPKRRSQNLVHGLKKIKQDCREKMYLNSMDVPSLVILSNLDKD